MKPVLLTHFCWSPLSSKEQRTCALGVWQHRLKWPATSSAGLWEELVFILTNAKCTFHSVTHLFVLIGKNRFFLPNTTKLLEGVYPMPSGISGTHRCVSPGVAVPQFAKYSVRQYWEVPLFSFFYVRLLHQGNILK